MIRSRPFRLSQILILPATLLLATALLLGAAACSPQPRQTLVPTLAATIALPESAPTGYPAGQNTLPTAYPADPQAGAAEAYPAGPGMLGGPVVENLSRITARLVEQAPAENAPDLLRLRVEVLSSAPVEGYVEYAAGAVGQQIDVLVPVADLPQLAPGDRLSAEVRYEGDERGGAYYAGAVERITP